MRSGKYACAMIWRQIRLLSRVAHVVSGSRVRNLENSAVVHVAASLAVSRVSVYGSGSGGKQSLMST